MIDFKGLGTSFLCGYTQFIGENFIKNLEDIANLGFNSIRLATRWDWIESRKGEYIFDNYRSIINKAKELNLDVIITLGIKSPGWPEFFYPSWFEINSFFSDIKLKNKSKVLDDLFKYIEQSVNEYSKYSCITAIQIENEAFTKFGPNSWKLNEWIVSEEVKLIKKQTDLPVLLTTPLLAPYSYIWERFYFRKAYDLCQKYADIIGIHCYPNVIINFFGKEFLIKSVNNDWKYISELVRKSNKPVYITELQAEPWEPKDKVFFGNVEKISLTREDFLQNLDKAKKIGVEKIFLWNGEYLLSEIKTGRKYILK